MAFQFKRGDTFSLSGQVDLQSEGQLVLDMTGWAGKSQVRTLATGTLIAELTFAWLDATQRLLSLVKANTQDWPLGVAELDIQFTNPQGDVVSTQTTAFDVVKDITYA
jgi:hypothetical protein